MIKMRHSTDYGLDDKETSLGVVKVRVVSKRSNIKSSNFSFTTYKTVLNSGKNMNSFTSKSIITKASNKNNETWIKIKLFKRPPNFRRFVPVNIDSEKYIYANPSIVSKIFKHTK